MSYKVWTLGTFDITAYREANPDVPAVPNFAIWHFVRYRDLEGRASGQHPITHWLLTQFLRRNVSAKSVKSLQRILKAEHASQNENTLKNFCTDHNLSYGIVQGHIAKFENDKISMQMALNQPYPRAHSEDALILHFDLLKACGFSNNIKTVINNAFLLLNESSKLSLKFYRALFQITQARGIQKINDKTVLQAILQHMAISDYVPTRSYMSDLWSVGIYFSPETFEDEELKAQIPKYLHRAFRDGPPIFTEPMRGWEVFFQAMAHNVLGGSPRFIVLDANKTWQFAQRDEPRTAVCVRVLTRQYWVDKTVNPEFAGHLNAFKKLCAKVASNDHVLYPVPAGQIYDLSHFKTASVPLLSYHTFSEKPGHEADIHFKESALKGFYSRDRCGFSGWACPVLSGNVDSEEADKFYMELRRRLINARQSKYQQGTAHDEDFSGPFVFVPLQVPGDVVARLGRVDIFETLDLILGDSDILERCGLRSVVVKIHPKDNSVYTQKCLATLTEKHGSKLMVTDASIHDVLPKADIVMTVNSGVGVEALLYLKPVVTLGGSDYTSVAVNFDSVEGAEEALSTAMRFRGISSFEADVKDYLFKFYRQNAFQIDDECAGLDEMEIRFLLPSKMIFRKKFEIDTL